MAFTGRKAIAAKCIVFPHASRQAFEITNFFCAAQAPPLGAEITSFRELIWQKLLFVLAWR
jgi:hypothetical protein